VWFQRNKKEEQEAAAGKSEMDINGGSRFGLGKMPNLQVFRSSLYLDTYVAMEQNKYHTHSYSLNK
jgi:hypothetical protein